MGERWSSPAMRELMYGPRRFGEIRANLPGISANVLTQRLEGLEASGIPRGSGGCLPGQRAGLRPDRLGARGGAADPRSRPLGGAITAARSAAVHVARLDDDVARCVDGPRRRGVRLVVAFRFPDDAFVATVADGSLTLRRGEETAVDATFAGDTMAMRVTLYGKAPFDSAEGAAVTGDRAAAAAFADLFRLPEKIA
ncbi:winged helix-turn-helix transcriptional regulator [Sphingomonas sp. MMS24-JH45]